MQGRVVRIQLLQLRQQNLHILQLAAFLPIVDQQHPRPAVGGVALNDFLQLFLRRFQLFREPAPVSPMQELKDEAEKKSKPAGAAPAGDAKPASP